MSAENVEHARCSEYILKHGSISVSLHNERGKYMSDLLTVREVAKILRVDDTTVRRWVKQGALEAVVLPHVRTRQAYRIKRGTLDRVLGDTVPAQ